MLENPVDRESIKAVAGGLATSSGEPVVGIMAGMLGIGVEALGYLGEKRSRELFDLQELIDKTAEKLRTDDNFAAFVFDAWRRHNFESSEERRLLLKEFLEKSVDSDISDFENFSRILDCIQNISFKELDYLRLFYEAAAKTEQENRRYPGNELKTPQYSMDMIFNRLKIPNELPENSEAANAFSQLASRGLIAVDYRGIDRGGPWFAMNKFGKLFLEVVKSD